MKPYHETLPRISQSATAHYVTQQSIWDCQRLGPLTDAKIFEYELLGKYGPEAKQRAEEVVAARRMKSKATKITKIRKQALQAALDSLLGDLC